MELDFKKIISALLTNLRVIAGVTLFCAVAAFLFSTFCVTPVYTSQTLLHVSNIAEKKTAIVTTSDVQVSRDLLDTCVVILNSRTVLDKVAEQSGLDYKAADIKGMISAESVSGTEIFKISVTHTEPNEAQIIAETITQIAPGEIKRVLNGGTVSVIDYATLPLSPSAPNILRNTILGGLLGAVLSILVFLVVEAMDSTVRDEEILEEEFDIPIIGMIPTFELTEKEPKGFFGRLLKRRES